MGYLSRTRDQCDPILKNKFRNILLRAGEDVRVKNLNGSADVECGGRLLIDGAHGHLKITAGSKADLHLDSSLESAKIKAPEIIIRTPPDQNCHQVVFKVRLPKFL